MTNRDHRVCAALIPGLARRYVVRVDGGHTNSTVLSITRTRLLVHVVAAADLDDQHEVWQGALGMGNTGERGDG